LHDVHAAAQVLRQELAGLLTQIPEHRAGLEHRERTTATRRFLVDDGGDAVVGGDGQELRLELLALADVDLVGAVWDAGFLHEDADLLSVGCGPEIEIDHVPPFCLRMFAWRFCSACSRSVLSMVSGSALTLSQRTFSPG